MTDKAEKAVPAEKHLVLYTDAGVAPGNPGPAGMGIHGYVFQERTSKQFSGNPTHSPTAAGYIDKADFRKMNKDFKEHEVEVVEYVDGSVNLPTHETNQYAEVMALCKGLELASELGVKSVTALSDNKYAVEGINGWVYKWAKNNWRKPDGSPYSNRAAFENLLNAKRLLEQANVELTVKWVKGHAGELGNERADFLATVARNQAQLRQPMEVYLRRDAKGYWKSEVEKHPFYHLDNVYVANIAKTIGVTTYFTGSHGKEEDEVGARRADSSFAILEMSETNKDVDMVLKLAQEVKERRRIDTEPFVRVVLTNLYDKKVYESTQMFGPQALEAKAKVVLNLFSVSTKKPVLIESDPPFLAYQLVEDLEELHHTFQLYAKDSPDIVKTDITDHLYERVIKGKKEETQLKPAFVVGSRRLTLPVNYRAGDNIEQAQVTLIFGTGMLGRNEYKRIEDLNPKVEVITWSVGEQVFRYAVVITIDGARGIWSNIYANYRFIKLANPPLDVVLEDEEGKQISI